MTNRTPSGTESASRGMTRRQYVIWRLQRWGPLPDYHGDAQVVHHSRWRAALRLCRCMGCVMDRSERTKPPQSGIPEPPA